MFILQSTRFVFNQYMDCKEMTSKHVQHIEHTHFLHLNRKSLVLYLSEHYKYLNIIQIRGSLELHSVSIYFVRRGLFNRRSGIQGHWTFLILTSNEWTTTLPSIWSPWHLHVPLSGPLNHMLVTTVTRIRSQPLAKRTWATRWFAFLLDLRKREEFPEKEPFTRRWALTAGRTLGFHLLDLHKTYIWRSSCQM